MAASRFTANLSHSIVPPNHCMLAVGRTFETLGTEDLRLALRYRAPVGRTVDTVARCGPASLPGAAARSIMLRLQPLLNDPSTWEFGLGPAKR